ncbi:MAG: DUF4190 domain-containing protein, partial [Acidimicrobiales bacterium]
MSDPTDSSNQGPPPSGGAVPPSGGFIPPSAPETQPGSGAPPWAPPPPGGWGTPPPASGPPVGAPAAPGGWPSQQPYAAPPQYGGYGGPVAPKNNPLAVGSLIASLCGLIPFVGFLAAIAGIVMGFIARKQIRESNGMQGGAGLALAGIIIGFVLIGLAILLVIAM